jgi:hypothetical protein
VTSHHRPKKKKKKTRLVKAKKRAARCGFRCSACIQPPFAPELPIGASVREREGEIKDKDPTTTHLLSKGSRAFNGTQRNAHPFLIELIVVLFYSTWVFLFIFLAFLQGSNRFHRENCLNANPSPTVAQSLACLPQSDASSGWVL